MKEFSVLEYGAVANAAEMQTEYIQKAIDDAFLQGGGEVVIPAGEYHITSLRLRSRVCLHLLENAVLTASRNVEDYFILKSDVLEPVDEEMFDEGSVWETKDSAFTHFHRLGNRWHNGIIRALYAEDIAIIGEAGSVIDGANSFDPLGEEAYRGPHGISILNCKNVTLKGYTVRHSGNWANKIQDCTNVLAENLTSLAGHDGFHFTSCDDVVIRNCCFYTGDDCVAGFDNRRVLVENCELNSACSAFRMGGTDVLIRNCRIFAPAKYMFRGIMSEEDKRAGILSNDAKGIETRYNMLSFFTYYADYTVAIRETPGNIVVQDCTVEGADRLLHFNYSGNETWQINRPLTGIVFENIKASNIGMALNVYGDKQEPCSLTMKNVEVSFREGNECDAFIRAANLKELHIENLSVENTGRVPLVKLWEDRMPEMDIRNVSGDLADETVVHAKEAFICTAI